jgi:hypothetical protein
MSHPYPPRNGVKKWIRWEPQAASDLVFKLKKKRRKEVEREKTTFYNSK